MLGARQEGEREECGDEADGELDGEADGEEIHLGGGAGEHAEGEVGEDDGR